MEYKQAEEYIKETLLALNKNFKEWQPFQTRADERAYEILGRIHEESAAIDGNDVKRQALVDVISRVPEVQESKKTDRSHRHLPQISNKYIIVVPCQQLGAPYFFKLDRLHSRPEGVQCNSLWTCFHAKGGAPACRLRGGGYRQTRLRGFAHEKHNPEKRVSRRSQPSL